MSDILLTETAPRVISLAAAQARVNFGSMWLDANYPCWYDHIDVTTLDINNPYRCVLGQIAPHYGFVPSSEHGEGYSWFLRKVGTNSIIAYGFAGSPQVPGRALTEAWTEKILARRAA